MCRPDLPALSAQLSCLCLQASLIRINQLPISATRRKNGSHMSWNLQLVKNHIIVYNSSIEARENERAALVFKIWDIFILFSLNLETNKFYVIILATDFQWKPNYLIEYWAPREYADTNMIHMLVFFNHNCDLKFTILYRRPFHRCTGDLTVHIPGKQTLITLIFIKMPLPHIIRSS
jgi:hypothetical protein